MKEPVSLRSAAPLCSPVPVRMVKHTFIEGIMLTSPYCQASSNTVSALLNGTSRALPSPTILFLCVYYAKTRGRYADYALNRTPPQLHSLTSSTLSQAKRSHPLFFLAWRHKLAALQEGFVTKDTFWDRMAFAKARETVLGEMSQTLRAVIIADGESSTLF